MKGLLDMAPVEGIKLGFKLADLAKSQGKNFTNIKLKNNAELNILKSENAYDVYITRKDRLLSATGIRSNPNSIASFIENLMIKIAKSFEI